MGTICLSAEGKLYFCSVAPVVASTREIALSESWKWQLALSARCGRSPALLPLFTQIHT
jgi:hypothetical protein